ncbi:MAG: carboxyl transferase [Eubacterium sp.]|nr:carboxyl transferase [Eubacterium sp.]
MSNTKARERIDNLLDDNSFVEIGALVKARSTDFNIQETDTPSDGVVTGYGLINGELVFVYSQDPDVLGGSIGEMHAKKIMNIYEKAIDMGAPIIGLIDSSGFRVQESVDALEAFGQIYFMQSNAYGIIPQITMLFGECGGALSILSKLSDFTFMEKDSAKLFVNSPNTIADNKTVDSSSADYQGKIGNVDFVVSESDIYTKVRNLVSTIPSNSSVPAVDVEATDDLNRGVEIENKIANPTEVIKELSDDAFVIEAKKDYSKDIVTAFIKLNGVTIGVVANKEYDGQNKFTTDGLKKASDFVITCDSLGIPILTLTNCEGFDSSFETEKDGVSEASNLVFAFSNATVPKVNLIVGKAIGSGYMIMNSKATGADMVYALPKAQISVMEASKASEVIYGDNSKVDEFKKLQGSIQNVASRGYIDTIINPIDTRKYLIGAFEMLYTKEV